MKKRRIATKEDVNRSPSSVQNSMENDPFMKRMGFKDLQDDYNAFVSDLNSGKNKDSYDGNGISNWTEEYVDNLAGNNISNWIEDYVDNLAFGSGEDAVQSTTGKSPHEYDIFDYSRAFNRGFERGRDGIVNVFLHPLDTLKGMGNLISAGANALTDLATDSFDPDAHQRNMMREAAILQAVSNFKEADSLARVELLAELTSGTILGSAFGGGMVSAVGKTASLTSKVAVKLSESRYALFGEKVLNINPEITVKERILRNISESKLASESSNFSVFINKSNALNIELEAGFGQLSDIKIRFWYNETVAIIPKLNAQWQRHGMSLENRALNAYDIRHQARMKARGFMIEKNVEILQIRDIEKYQNPHGPTFEYLYGKYQLMGYSNENIYQSIIEQAKITNHHYNAKYTYNGN